MAQTPVPAKPPAKPKGTAHAGGLDSAGASRNQALARILELSVPVSVVLAEQPMPVETILKITAGTILEFDVPFWSDLPLIVGNRPLARGQAVKVGEHFGLRLTAIDSVRRRIEALGAE